MSDKPSQEKDYIRKIPLAQVDDLEELKIRYSIYSDEVLSRWVDAVTGSHRRAIAALLEERGAE